MILSMHKMRKDDFEHAQDGGRSLSAAVGWGHVWMFWGAEGGLDHQQPPVWLDETGVSALRPPSPLGVHPESTKWRTAAVLPWCRCRDPAEKGERWFSSCEDNGGSGGGGGARGKDDGGPDGGASDRGDSGFWQ